MDRRKARDDGKDEARAREERLKRVLPYSAIQGQQQAKLALELAYVAPRLGGVLLSGERGTGKSTVVRAFSRMVQDDLPVTLPINATEDRVVGGLDVTEALEGREKWKPGLLHAAGKASGDGDGKAGILYVDEVNLLDDHIVNILLDVTSTGILDVQREGISRPGELLELTLVGTMNPEEGGLRPQLLDRFALMVQVRTEEDHRIDVLQTVVEFDKALDGMGRGETTKEYEGWIASDKEHRDKLDAARRLSPEISDAILKKCVALASQIGVDGHRGERVLALAARAHAAIDGVDKVTVEHLRAVAPMALQHRQKGLAERQSAYWGEHHEGILDKVLTE